MDAELRPGWRPRWPDVLVGLTILGLLAGLGLKALTPLHERYNRQRCADNLRQIGQAIHTFHDTYGYFPSQGSWSDHGIAYDRLGEPLAPPQQTAGWAFQILPFLQLDHVYKTSDVAYGADGLSANVRPFGTGVPFPDNHGPAGSYYIDVTTGLVGPARASVPRVYYCPSRRPAGLYSWNDTNLTDYCSVAPGMVPMSLDSAGYGNEDTGGLIYGWSRAEGNIAGRPGYNDWQYGRHHGVVPGGNWGNRQQKHTFASITDGNSLTMMIGEKFLAPSQYSGGSGGDQFGPFSGAGADTVRTSATGLPWPGESAPTGVGHVNPSPDRDDADKWVFAMGFGSPHPKVFNAVFADGSVHNIMYGIDAQVFNAVGNMNDGTGVEWP
jgi:hypothetical protein